MNYAEIIKRRVLTNKISEYFSKNPNKQSVIVKAAADDTKVYWRAVRESANANTFKITEVRTMTETYNVQIAEASPAFADLSKAFMDAMSNPGDKAAYSNALKLMSTKQGMLSDQGEQQRADAMLSNLGALAKSSTVASKLNQPKAQGAMPESTQRGKRKVNEAQGSPAYAKASSIFTSVISSGDHSKMSAALKKINDLLPSITDPGERKMAGSMVGGLTGGIDSSTAGGGNALDMKNANKATKASDFFNVPGAKLGTGVIGGKENPFNHSPPPAKSIPKIVHSKRPMNQGKERRKAVVREAGEYQKASTLFTSVVTPPFSYDKLKSALNQFNALLQATDDPREKHQIASMIGVVTGMYGAENDSGRKFLQADAPRESLSLFRNTFTEAPQKKRHKKDSEEEEEIDNTSDIDDDGTSDASEVDASVGLDSPDDDYVPEPDDERAMDQAQDQDASAKDQVVQDRLKGQTIRTANIDMSDDGSGALVLDLVSSQVPARLEWDLEGRVTFKFKGQNYVVRK